MNYLLKQSTVANRRTFDERVSEIPFLPATTFVNRDSILKDMHRQLNSPSSASSPTQILAMRGMGGSGKTQLALRYAFKFSEQYQARIWIEASTQERLITDFASIRYKYAKSIQQALGSAQSLDGSAVAETIAWIDQVKGQWLVIFDNADVIDLRTIRNYFSNALKGHVIVTTRQSKGARMSVLKGVEVQGTQPGESLEIFFKNAAVRVPSGAQKLAAARITQKLGELPLAIELAGAYISGKPQLVADLDRYFEILIEQRKVILAKTPQQYVSDYGLSVLTVWESSYSTIEQTSRLAGHLMTVFGLHDPSKLQPWMVQWSAAAWKCQRNSGLSDFEGDKIIEYFGLDDYLSSTGTEDDEQTWIDITYDAAISEIESHHLIHKDTSLPPEVRIMYMHPLVHSWAFDRLSASEKSESATMVLFMLAMASTTTSGSADVLVGQQISYFTRFLSHVRFDDNTKKPLKFLMKAAIEQRQWASLKGLAPYVFKDEENGDLKALGMAISCRSVSENTEQLIELARYHLEQWLRRTPPDEFNIAEAQWLLGVVLTESIGDRQLVDEAGEMLRQAIKYFETVNGVSGMRTLQARRSLAVYHCQIEDFHTAINMGTKLVAMIEREFPTNRPEILRFKVALGNTYGWRLLKSDPRHEWDRCMKDYIEAKSIFTGVLPEQEALLGFDHLDAISTRNVLGTLKRHLVHRMAVCSTPLHHVFHHTTSGTGPSDQRTSSRSKSRKRHQQ